MLINFFKIAYRNIIRGKWFSVINISGLAIGNGKRDADLIMGPK